MVSDVKNISKKIFKYIFEYMHLMGFMISIDF